MSCAELHRRRLPLSAGVHTLFTIFMLRGKFHAEKLSNILSFIKQPLGSNRMGPCATIRLRSLNATVCADAEDRHLIKSPRQPEIYRLKPQLKLTKPMHVTAAGFVYLPS